MPKGCCALLVTGRSADPLDGSGTACAVRRAWCPTCPGSSSDVGPRDDMAQKELTVMVGWVNSAAGVNGASGEFGVAELNRQLAAGWKVKSVHQLTGTSAGGGS